MAEIIGIWVAAFLTLCIFSFLYKDNPLYKFAEHLYVGSSAAYMLVYFYFFNIKPMLIDKFIAETGLARWILIIPTFLGVIMLLRIHPKIGWISRWSIAFTMGIGAGIGIVAGIHGYILPQTKATFLPLFIKGDLIQSANNIILVVGVLTTFLFFYFSKEHKGLLKPPVKIGMAFIMVSFGASFGYTVMARLSLLIGRIYFLLHNWLHLI
ncbi:hypothetical protein KAW65_04425 [candidate division WOR-3 bacterium]|nr:hypothetical protein [candidate division WOR-3 bacterium]